MAEMKVMNMNTRTFLLESAQGSKAFSTLNSCVGTREHRGDREGVLGRWPGYVNFTKVIFGVGSRSPETSALPLW